MQANAAAWELEMQAQDTPALFGEEMLELLSRGKAAPAIITLHAVAAFLGDDQQLDRLENSVFLAVKASILGDDLQDWRTDYAEGHLTGFLVELVSITGSRDDGISEIERLEKNLDSTALDVTHYQMMIGCLDEALAVVRELPCRAWKNLLNYHREIAENNLGVILTQRFLSGF